MVLWTLRSSCLLWMSLLEVLLKLHDVDGNDIIDPSETFEVVKAILAIVSPNSKDARCRARNISKTIDENSDGVLTQSEFVKCCLKNDKLTMLLVPVQI